MPDKDLTTLYWEKSDELQVLKDFKAAFEHVLKIATFRSQVYATACRNQVEYNASELADAWEQKEKEKNEKKATWTKKHEEEEEAKRYGPRKPEAESGTKTVVKAAAKHAAADLLLPEPLGVALAAYEIGDIFLSAELPDRPGERLEAYVYAPVEYYLDPGNGGWKQWVNPSVYQWESSRRVDELYKTIVLPIHRNDFNFTMSLEKYIQHTAMRSRSYKEAEEYKIFFCRGFWTGLQKLLSRLLPGLKLDKRISELTAEVARLVEQLGGPPTPVPKWMAPHGRYGMRVGPQ